MKPQPYLLSVNQAWCNAVYHYASAFMYIFYWTARKCVSCPFYLFFNFLSIQSGRFLSPFLSADILDAPACNHNCDEYINYNTFLCGLLILELTCMFFMEQSVRRSVGRGSITVTIIII